MVLIKQSKVKILITSDDSDEVKDFMFVNSSKTKISEDLVNEIVFFSSNKKIH